jgi:hypothetical protein
MSTWSELPNAKHIDRILASSQENPEAWKRTPKPEGVVNADALGKSFDDAECTSRGVIQDAIWWLPPPAWLACMALIAWDDCGYLLDEKVEHVEFLSNLGVHAATLLYPACVLLHEN